MTSPLKMVKLPGDLVEYGRDTGHDVWVNPKYVCSVTQSSKPMVNGEHAGRRGIEVEFEGNGGYRTRCVTLFGPSLKEVVSLLLYP